MADNSNMLWENMVTTYCVSEGKQDKQLTKVF